ncbi:MAG: hypothetical protein ACI9Y1_000551 [Lentisphaeria bacterium]|jgi:hypothetical protein
MKGLSPMQSQVYAGIRRGMTGNTIVQGVLAQFPGTTSWPCTQSGLAHESIRDPYRFDFLGLNEQPVRVEICHLIIHTPRTALDE